MFFEQPSTQSKFLHTITQKFAKFFSTKKLSPFFTSWFGWAAFKLMLRIDLYDKENKTVGLMMLLLYCS